MTTKKPTEVSIRPYSSELKSVVMASWVQAFRKGHSFLSEGFLRHEKVNFGALFLPKASGLCLFNEDHFVGYAGFIECDLGMLFIDCNFQGKGYGAELLSICLNTMRKQYKHAALDVFNKNKPARQMYERAGFKLVEQFRHDATGEQLLHLQLNFE